MTCYHYEVTLTGSAQPLSSVTGAVTVGARVIDIQAHRNNSHIFNVGGAGVTMGYGMEIPVPTSNAPAAPYRIGDFGAPNNVYMQDVYVIGTIGEKVRVNVYV